MSVELAGYEVDPNREFGFGRWAAGEEEEDAQGSDTNPSPNSGDTAAVADLRKLRRMISNRESARRSRMRKQRHLEGLRSQASRLRAENRELASRLGGVAQYITIFQRDNDRLRSESASLRHRLTAASRHLVSRQLQGVSAAAAPGGATGELPKSSIVV